MLLRCLPHTPKPPAHNRDRAMRSHGFQSRRSPRDRRPAPLEWYEKIRYLHEREGLSQRKIAEILGVSRNTVKRYFDGSHVPWERQGTSGRQICSYG